MYAYEEARGQFPSQAALDAACGNARARGRCDGIAAGSWAADGNTSEEHARKVLAMLDEGDPLAADYLPRRPDLSGEWSEDLTPTSLAIEVGYIDEDWIMTKDDDMDAIAQAYEEGVSETFEQECERVLREAMGKS